MDSLETILRFKAKFQPEGIILDTNILVLFLIGNYNPLLIGEYELLQNSNKKYSVADFELLKKIVSYFKKLVITPHIIAELSNLSITRKNNLYGDKFIYYLRTVIEFLKRAEERHQKCDCLWGMELTIIGEYGFTDMTMFELSKQTKMPILTDDLSFYNYSYDKIPIIKLEHIINQQYQSIFTH